MLKALSDDGENENPITMIEKLGDEVAKHDTTEGKECQLDRPHTRDQPEALEDILLSSGHVNTQTCNKAPAAVKKFLLRSWTYIKTPTGFLVVLYGLNVVAWGGMLFLLLLHAAPAMNHPDGGDADSSPRKIWIEIDSQILNVLFCIPAWGLAPWRLRDAFWLLQWRLDRNHMRSQDAFGRLTAKNKKWFRATTVTDGQDVDLVPTKIPITAGWKLDFVVWMLVANTLLQVGMATFMWHWDRFTRPGWGVGVFIGGGCLVAILAGLMMWWEGRRTLRRERNSDP